ncbi:MAG: CPBP family intramembrane metalloprotease [Tissierella sp.]|nr:CPBP family intramembrane metalloprotease [Tissierella sp.]
MLVYIYVTGYYILFPTMPRMSDGSTNILLNIIQVFIAVACEEIIYRGIFLENLRKYGDAFAIIASGHF